MMTPRQRIMTALALKESDCVPFADWIDDRVKQTLIKAMCEHELNEAEFARRMGLDAICLSSERYLAPQFCKTAIGADGREILTDEGLLRTTDDLDKMVLPDLADESYFDEANSITEFCKPENVLAMINARNKYGKYPIHLD